MGSLPCHISASDLWFKVVQESANDVPGQICALEVKHALAGSPGHHQKQRPSWTLGCVVLDERTERLNFSGGWKEELLKLVPGNTGVFNAWTLKRKQEISELYIFPQCGTSVPKGLSKLCKEVWTSLVITDT